MRKVTLSIVASLDGFIARRDGTVDWLSPRDLAPDHDHASFMAEVDTAVMGRRTWDLACEREGERPFADLRCVIFSRRRAGQRQRGVQFTDEDPETLMRRLRQMPGRRGGIWLVGGGEIARLCLEAGVVNEVVLTLVPVLLGDGLPLFLPRAGTTWLKLLDCRSEPNGRVHLRYAPSGVPRTREPLVEAARTEELVAAV